MFWLNVIPIHPQHLFVYKHHLYREYKKKLYTPKNANKFSPIRVGQWSKKELPCSSREKCIRNLRVSFFLQLYVDRTTRAQSFVVHNMLKICKPNCVSTHTQQILYIRIIKNAPHDWHTTKTTKNLKMIWNYW